VLVAAESTGDVFCINPSSIRGFGQRLVAARDGANGLKERVVCEQTADHPPQVARATPVIRDSRVINLVG